MITKYRVLRDNFRFNGVVYNRGDAIARDDILAVAPEKLGSLLRTRFIDEPPDQPLTDLGMDELRDLARDVGLEGPLPRRKSDLITAIEEGKHGS